MIKKIDTEDFSLYESFTDIILSISIILIVLVLFLSLNVNQKLNNVIKTNEFTGGITRPYLDISAFEMDISNANDVLMNNSPYLRYSNEDRLVYIRLYGNSAARVKNSIQENKLISAKDESSSGYFDFSISDLLSIAPAIDIGSFKVDNEVTSILVPNYIDKNIFLTDINGNINQSVYSKSSKELGETILSFAWDILNKKIYPIRNYSEYSTSRLNIYVESLEVQNRKFIVLGNAYFEIPQSIENGQLSFLTTLSSSISNIIYLGKVKELSSTRAEFFKENGFEAAYDYSIKQIYHRAELIPYKRYSNRFGKPDWNDLPLETQKAWIEKYKTSDNAQTEFNKEADETVKRASFDLYINNQLANYILGRGQKIEYNDLILPPNMKYPEAWKAYIKFRMEQKPTPPEWFINDFLHPLGFDKRIINENKLSK